MTDSSTVPRWSSAPGATISELMSVKNVEQRFVAMACDLDEARFEALLDGKLPLTENLAERLSACLGSSPRFWLRREEQFREAEALLEADVWVESLPLSYIATASGREVPRHWLERIDACLSYFGQTSYSIWKTLSERQLESVQFRTSETFRSQAAAVSTWLRAGEIAVSRHSTGKFDRDKLVESIPRLRSLTRTADPERFIGQLQQLTADCGVTCVVVPAPDKCAASAASRIFDDGRGLIQLSGRYLADDHFWFSFFHEVGHLIMHSAQPLHVDGDVADFEQGRRELEANEFSADVLWPLDERPKSWSRKPSKRDILRLAANLGVSPGIVVGQLQNSGVIDHSERNDLKRRYRRHGAKLTLNR